MLTLAALNFQIQEKFVPKLEKKEVVRLGVKEDFYLFIFWVVFGDNCWGENIVETFEN